MNGYPITFNTASVKFECFLVELNFLKISRNAPIVWKSIFLYSSTIANTFGVVVCLISIMDTDLYVFKVTRFDVFRLRSVAGDTFFLDN